MPYAKPGRPPLDPDDPSTTVTFKLPTKQYDDLAARALADRQSLSQWMRELLNKKNKVIRK